MFIMQEVEYLEFHYYGLFRIKLQTLLSGGSGGTGLEAVVFTGYLTHDQSLMALLTWVLQGTT